LHSGAQVAGRLAAIRAGIERQGRDPASVTIVGVTKGQPAGVCRAALEAGLRVLAENRVQEALAKMEEVPEVPEWHLIGHLQTNKARRAAGRFALIQSVDTPRLAEELARHGGAAVLLQVNVSREPAKHGADPEQATAVATELARLLDLRGLMAMGPATGDPAPAFAELRRLRDGLEQRLGRSLPVLSMGMSADWPVAVAAGSTMLRLGAALFGERG